MPRKLLLFVLSTALLAGAATLASAQELRWGSAAEPSSLDPQYHNLGPNNAMARHLFDRLLNTDKVQRLQPGLAVSYKPIADDKWEFKLRKGVKFSDGTEFTAKDFVYTVDRAPKVPNSPSSYSIYTKSIKKIETPDDYTLILHTDGPYPLLPNEVATLNVLSAKASAGKWSEELNKGDGLVGTGPYRFVEWVKGDRIVLERNDDYWGDKPDWERVVFRPMTNGSSRVAALLAGDVDFIDNVPTPDVARLKSDRNITLSSGVSNRVIYLHIDHDRNDSPFSKGPDGMNPLRYSDVRRALSIAINRDAIVERVMEGLAIPAGQLLPDGFFGRSDALHVDPYLPDEARAILKRRGLDGGKWKLTIHGPNDRYINDDKIAQAIAQFLTQVGIDMSVDTMPRNVYFGNATKRMYSLMLVGWGSGTGEPSSPLRSLLATYDKEAGMGTANRGRFSNKDMDNLLAQALRTVDDEKRGELLARATEIAMNNYGIIPLHYQVNTWATRTGMKYEARTDEASLAMSVMKE